MKRLISLYVPSSTKVDLIVTWEVSYQTHINSLPASISATELSELISGLFDVHMRSRDTTRHQWCAKARNLIVHPYYLTHYSHSTENWHRYPSTPKFTAGESCMQTGGNRSETHPKGSETAILIKKKTCNFGAKRQ